MTNFQETTRIVVAVITTMAEMPDDYVAREGLIYLPFMDRGIDTFQEAIDFLVDSGDLNRMPNHGLVITEQGRALARRLEDAMS